jgi:hypothetical protein
MLRRGCGVCVFVFVFVYVCVLCVCVCVCWQWIRQFECRVQSSSHPLGPGWSERVVKYRVPIVVDPVSKPCEQAMVKQAMSRRPAPDLRLPISGGGTSSTALTKTRPG